MTVEALFEDTLPRDRWGRPLIVPPDGGKPIGYTRVSTMAKALSDEFQLTQWKQRQVLIGATGRPDLLALAAAQKDDKTAMNKVVEQAMDAAASSSGANYGTALHALTEQHDRGQNPVVSGDARRDLDAYIARTEDIRMLAIETFVVVDEIECAGTFDRLMATGPCPASGCPGIHVGDVKTGPGEPAFPHGAVIQCAIYAHGTTYTPEAGRKVDLSKKVCQASAVLIHLPRQQGTCDLYWLDIATGWKMALVAYGVRRWQKSKPIRMIQP